MPKLVSGAGRLFRRKKSSAIAIEDDAKKKARLIKSMSARLEALTKKISAIKVRLHDTSLAYLELVRSQLKQKIGRVRPNRQSSVERRKLPRMVMMRMKHVASAVLNRAPRGKVVTFPQDSAAPDR